jgi:hypothetical protein
MKAKAQVFLYASSNLHNGVCCWYRKTSTRVIADKLFTLSYLHVILICFSKSNQNVYKLFRFFLKCHVYQQPWRTTRNYFYQAKIRTTMYQTGKMRSIAFKGCINLRITYFECFASALSVNFMHIGNFFCVSTDLHTSELRMSRVLYISFHVSTYFETGPTLWLEEGSDHYW